MGLLRNGALVALGFCFGGTALAAEAPAVAQDQPQARAEALLDHLPLKSGSALVVDLDTGETITAKNADAVQPIASLTKLMTALVVLDANQPRDEILEITSDDIDREKRTPSRLKIGTKLSREDLLVLALMASENRAALTLSRNYPGGRIAFIRQMNARAKALGMTHTHFADPAGLLSRSVSTANDLHRLLTAASGQPLIRDYSTRVQHTVRVVRNRKLTFHSSNRLVRRSSGWDIELQKTGFTNEAGRCLLMQANVSNRHLAMIFMDSFGKLSRYADASRVRRRLELEDRRHPRRLPLAKVAG